jgi:restriction system protein
MITEQDEVLPSTREEFLKLAAARASNNPVTLSIRTLLQYWYAKRRGYLITAEITRDLRAARLATDPPFTEGWIDTLTTLVPIASKGA